MKRSVLALGAAALAFTAAPALAKEGGHGNHGQHSGAAQAEHGKPAKTARAKRLKACPPGLAKKHTGCLPPGQWRKGDQLPESWMAQYLAYSALPDFYRDRYAASAGHRYVYRDDRVFVIDAVTRTILNVIIR